MTWRAGPATVFAGIGLVAAAVVFGASMAGAYRLEAVDPEGAAVTGTPAPSPGSDPAEASGGPGSGVEDLEAWIARTSGSGVPWEDLETAVGQDPFRPERTAPAERYRLPGEEVVVREASVDVEVPEAPPFRVVGTAVIPGGGMALVQLGEALPAAVTVGESVLGYRLTAVGAQMAALDGAAGRLVLPVEEQLRSASDDRRSRGRNAGSDAARALEQAQQALQERVQQMMRNAQGRGVFLQGRGGRGGSRGGGGGSP